MTSPLRRRLISGSSWGLLARAVGLVALVAVQALLARTLSITDFVAFGVITTSLIFLRWCAMFGQNNLVLRFISEGVAVGDGRRARRAIVMCGQLAAISTGLTALLVFAVLWPLGTQLLSVDRPLAVAVLVAIVLAFSAAIQLLSDILRGFHRFPLGTFLMGKVGGPLSNALFVVLFAGSLLLVSPSLEVALTAQALGLALAIPVGLVWTWRSMQRDLPPVESLPTQVLQPAISYSALVASGWPMCLTQLMFCASNFADVWLANSFCASERVADYVASKQMILMIFVPVTLMQQSIVSSIPELYSQRQLGRLERMLRVTATIAAVPSLVVLFTLILFPVDSLTFVFGPRFANAADVLMILSAAQIIVLLAGSSQFSLMMTGHERTVAILNALSTAALVVGGYFAALRYGIVGLALASAGTTAMRCFCAWAYTRIRVGVWTHPLVVFRPGWSSVE
jgi:O-antigen/teichoic acid export membrane protein